LIDRSEIVIKPGEFYSSDKDEVISTLLGSCISVALYDLSLPVGGLNHFLLPFPKNTDNPLFSNSGKYGINAMELLINDILKKGGEKKNLRAKVFGGSTVLALKKRAVYDIPKINIAFVFGFLETERIPVDAYSVGGTIPRRISFFTYDARVMMKFTKSGTSGLVNRENAFSHKLLEKTENEGKPIFSDFFVGKIRE